MIYYITNHKLFAKKNKKELFELLEGEGFTECDRLLKMAIYSLTKEEIDKLKQKISDLKEAMRELKTTNAKDMYISELKELNVS